MTDAADNGLLTWIRQSSPYIRAHRDKTFVISIPGETVSTVGFTQLIHDAALLNAMGIQLVICHGARPQIEHKLAEQGRQWQYVNNLRITDEHSLMAVKQAASMVRIEIEALLSMGVANSVMAGANINVVSGNFVTAKPIGVRDGVDYQYTGVVRKVDADAIRYQLATGKVVLISPLGYSPTGEVFNLSAEEVAAKTAQQLQAEKALFFINSDTLPNDAWQLRELNLAQAKSRIGQTEHPDTRHCLEVAIGALEKGVSRVHFLDQNVNGALLLELFTQDGCGMMISADLYEDIRDARIDDVGGILELIEPLEEKGILVKRSRQKLETEISNFTIMERDGMVIGCAALYPMTEATSAELACLAIHPSYLDTGRGNVLLEAMEKKAKAKQLEVLFVLTTQTAHWFAERGFEQHAVDALPVARQDMYNYKRNSKVLIKKLK